MEFWKLDNPLEFKTKTASFLEADEAKHNLILGINQSVIEGQYQKISPLFCGVSQDGKVLAAGLRTPPFPLLLSEMDDKCLELLADQLKDESLSGVVAINPVAKNFSEIWSQKTGKSFELSMAQKIYSISEVKAPEARGGFVTFATMKDLESVTDWMMDFAKEATPNERIPRSERRKRVEIQIKDKNVYLWKVEGVPKCMGVVAGTTPNGARIGYLFTPVKFRGQGFGSRTIAAITQKQLDSGKKFCFLYTDASNPTSNKIYQDIGYKYVCDSSSYLFR